MKNYFEILKNNALFLDITYSDFTAMFNCLSPREKAFKKNEIILMQGDTVNFIGIVIQGSVNVVKGEADGSEILFSHIAEGEIFGGELACAGIKQSAVSIVAAEDSELLFFDYYKIIHTCKNSCLFHGQMIENMLKILAVNNLRLNQKIDIISKRGLREKLLCFFHYHANGAKKFTVPFSRAELANYICADRSAVSNELSKMQKEGIIKYDKHQFELL